MVNSYLRVERAVKGVNLTLPSVKMCVSDRMLPKANTDFESLNPFVRVFFRIDGRD